MEDSIMNKKKNKQNNNREKIAFNPNELLPQKPKLYLHHQKDFQVSKIEFPEFICAKCGNPIEDLTSAIADKESGYPVHFDCVIEFLKKAEDLKPKEEIIYIGNGNFAIVYFANPKLRKDFKIVRLIEWEDKNKIYSWKNDVADLASKV